MKRRVTIHERSVGDATAIDIGGRMMIDEGADVFGHVSRHLVRQGR